jgi:hypothetical protein
MEKGGARTVSSTFFWLVFFPLSLFDRFFSFLATTKMMKKCAVTLSLNAHAFCGMKQTKKTAASK